MIGFNKKITLVAVGYTFLLCTICFFGIPNSGRATFSALLFYCLGAGVVWIGTLLFISRLSRSCAFDKFAIQSKKGQCVLYASGFLLCTLAMGIYSISFCGLLKGVSLQYSQPRFIYFFIPLSLLLAIYIAKRDIDSLSRLFIIALPFLLLPYAVTWFDFLSFGELENIDFELECNVKSNAVYFFKGLLVMLSSLILVPLIFGFYEKSSPKNVKEKSGCLLVSFGLFLLTAFAEAAKYCLWFGTSGVLAIKYPDRAMLAAVPGVNLQDIYAFCLYFSFLAELSIFAIGQKRCLYKLAPKIKSKYAQATCAVAAIAAYFLLFAFVVV